MLLLKKYLITDSMAILQYFTAFNGNFYIYHFNIVEWHEMQII